MRLHIKIFMKKQLLLLSSLGLLSLAALGQGDKPDAAMVQKIRDEGLNRSKVMETAFYLTDVNGPRLQGPGFMKAANWSKNKLTEWGLQKATLEPWGEWGKGWEVERSYIAITAPYYKPLIAVPKAWSGGTDGLKAGEIFYIAETDTNTVESYRDKLRGKIILIDQPANLKPSFEADADRFSDEALAKMAEKNTQPRDSSFRRTIQANRLAFVFNQKMRKLAKQAGALAVLTMSRGKDGTLFVGGDFANASASSTQDFLTDIVIAPEDYLTLCRLMKANVPVKMEVDVKTKFHVADTKGYNVVAEIPGTDPALKAEVVMLGAHLDSWHAATGATDNAAGCAVMMEAVRILKTLGVKPRRTVRIVLWSGEEQGLFGSRFYVNNHFVDPATKKPNAESENLSAYFNVDNGTGKIRGIYSQDNDEVGPIFTAWLEPFKDLGATTFARRSSGGTDHVSFSRVGLPGFGFIQDRIEYDTRTHHTNMDTYDHLQPDDLKQAATIVASFVYNAAMRDQKLPRKKQL